MSLKVKTIIAICVSIVLVGLAILVWAYQTGKVTIFGSEQTSNVTYEVKGADLNKGTADQNITLAANNIKLKQNASNEEGSAYLNIILINNTPPGSVAPYPYYGRIQEPMIGIGSYSLRWGDNPAGEPQMAPTALRFITTSHSQSQTLDIAGNNPQMKFLTQNGQELGNLYFEFSGVKEKYLGVSIYDLLRPLSSPNTQIMLVLTTVNTSAPSGVSVRQYNIGEKTPGTFNTAWYLEKFQNWQTQHPEIKVVVAQNENSENLGSPTLLWDGENKGKYWGLLRIIQEVDARYEASGLLTDRELVATKLASPPGNTEELLVSDLQNHNPKIILNPETYPNQGIYTYSTGSENVIKYNTFEPINPQTPGVSKITYRFSGSADNKTWSEPKPTQGLELAGLTSLTDYIPSDSKYFKVEITLSKGTDSPTLEGFGINYDINGTVPDNTNPSDAGKVIVSQTNGTSNIGKLVSTGSILWINILIALIIGAIITWLLVRKSSK